MRWTVNFTQLPERRPVHGDRGTSFRTHRVCAISADRRRVIRRDLTTAEVITFDADQAWADQVAAWHVKAGR